MFALIIEFEAASLLTIGGYEMAQGVSHCEQCDDFDVPTLPSPVSEKLDDDCPSRQVRFCTTVTTYSGPSKKAPKTTPSPLPLSTPKPILISRPAIETVEIMRSLYLREQEERQAYLRKLTMGSKLVKYNANGKPEVRYFHVSDDGTELLWRKREKSRSRTRCRYIEVPSPAQ